MKRDKRSQYPERSVYVGDALWAWLTSYAASQGKTASGVVREMLARERDVPGLRRELYEIEKITRTTEKQKK